MAAREEFPVGRPKPGAVKRLPVTKEQPESPKKQ